MSIMNRIFRKIKRDLSDACLFLQDLFFTTYANFDGHQTLNRIFESFDTALLRNDEKQIILLADLYCHHFFDLLGSGWVQVYHGKICRGLEGFRYTSKQKYSPRNKSNWFAQRINKSNYKKTTKCYTFVNKDYRPIDWQLDFKSGYRWPEKKWYRHISFGKKLGVDVKVPWELARMQHLPMLAFAYGLTQDNKYSNEFCNQILDFIATNPPRFGVNWVCTMDVAIRAVNELVAYDLFKAMGAKFSKAFENVFICSIYEHGKHIIHNLEWITESMPRSNHYLADICGLLFIASYLPSSHEIDAWLVFAIQELIKETDLQFYPEGTNVEASTCYHCLSTEMVIYTTALILSLPEKKIQALQKCDYRLCRARSKLKQTPLKLYAIPGSQKMSPFPQWYFERLEKMAEFVVHITKPNNLIPQIGDNDSGRFLKLQPIYLQMSVKQAKERYQNLELYNEMPDDAVYLDEQILNHQHIVAAAQGIFNRQDFHRFLKNKYIDTILISILVKDIKVSSYHRYVESKHQENKKDLFHELIFDIGNKLTESHYIPVGGDDLCAGLGHFAYRDFGLYIYRSDRLYLAIRCGPGVCHELMGHAHYDQLSIELNVDGKDWIVDPGTYVYTALPSERSKYRSAMVHAKVPNLSTHTKSSMFACSGRGVIKQCITTSDTFIGIIEAAGILYGRKIKIRIDGIEILDYNQKKFSLVGHQSVSFSPGYGKILKGKQRDCL